MATAFFHFCVYPWIETILNLSSNYTLCCKNISDPFKDKKTGKAWTLTEHSLEDWWNSSALREVRRKMLAGEPIKPHCDWCYIDEAKGLSSMRQHHSKEWLESKYGKEIMERIKTSRSNAYRVNKQPLYLDLNFSSLCNLQCRMCDGRQSSKIKQDQKKIMPGLKINNYKLWQFLKPVNYLQPVPKNIEWDKKTLWKTLYKWAPGVKKLYLTGGEPLLVKENWTLIDHLKEKGYSKDIHLAFNTNCTVSPDKIIDTFKHFRFVEVRFSIDGYKETQEYIRYPSKWKNVERNTIKILKSKTKNTSLYFVPVVQIYNILDMPKLFKWIDRLLANIKYLRFLLTY